MLINESSPLFPERRIYAWDVICAVKGAHIAAGCEFVNFPLVMTSAQERYLLSS